MATWPTLKEVRSLLRLQPDPTEDGLIQSALSAATSHGIARMGSLWVDNGDGTFSQEPIYPGDTTELPDQAHQACLLHSARLYRRRDSLDGTIGFGDLGAIRIGKVDADVEYLYSSCGPVVFG